MGKSAPKAPDPAQTAAAQGAWNSFTAQQQQQMNMIGQNTPYGSLAYNQTGTTWITDPNGKRVEVPTYTATTTLTPEQQEIFGKNQKAQSNLAQIAQDQSARVGDILNNPFEFNNQDAEKWAYDLASPRIIAQQQQNEDSLRTRLINQGIRPGTPAWDREMTRLTNANSDQLNQLALTGRNQAFSESLATRNQPLNEIIGLMSGTQIQNPTSGFTNTPQTQVGGVDYSGLVSQNYQNELNSYNAQMGGMFGLGGTLGLGAMKFGLNPLNWSDRRLKSDVRRVGKTASGIPVYEYTIFGRRERGVMADEVERAIPEAVVVHASGYKMVDYSKVL